jgi:hypothetical protein
MNINEPTPEMSLWHQRAKLVRDVVGGEYCIRQAREAYLPRFRASQSDEEYNRFLNTTSFFPATARTAQGRRGLMFARNVVLNGTALDPIANVLTPQGDDWRSTAEHVVYETLQTNFTGLLIDHPAAPEGRELNAENALEEGFRPFMHVYPLESILEVTRGLVRNQQKLIRVRLLESKDRVLELRLVDGFYQQTVHSREDGTWKVFSRVPTKEGQPLDEIPFDIVSDNNSVVPRPGVLEDVSRLNIAHYVAQGRINALQVFGSGLVPILKGIQPEKKIVDGVETTILPELNFGPGGYLLLPNPDSDFGFLEPEGKMASDLRQTKKDLEDQMAACASRMLEPPAVAPEAPENSARRSAAEDSATASLAQTYASRISRSLSRMAWWNTPGAARFTGKEVTLTLNTDYKTRGMTAQDRTVAMAELQAGVRSWEDWFYERRDAGLVNSSLTPEQERARIEADNADRPFAQPL